MSDHVSGETDRDAMIGRVVASRYRIEERIGRGAMGVVYRAKHVKLGRVFAVKLLHLDLLMNEKLRRRFVREAELAGTLTHRNVVGVVDVGETLEGLHYIVMEYAEGPTLSTIIADGPLPGPRVIAIARQLCDGLQHAHEHGLIHRDFKPDNVIVERDRDGRDVARVLDFGIAVVRDNATSTERERLTTAGMTLGTPHYMAPEHVTGQAIDHRIDLFALGVVMFEMLCGKLPFDGDGVDVARANLIEPTPAMSERAPNVDVDPLLEAFTRRLLDKSPDRRPPTAIDARDLLDLIANDRAVAAAQLGVADPDGSSRARGSGSRSAPAVAFPAIGRVTPPTPWPAIAEPRVRPSGSAPPVDAKRSSGSFSDPSRRRPRVLTSPIDTGPRDPVVLEPTMAAPPIAGPIAAEPANAPVDVAPTERMPELGVPGARRYWIPVAIALAALVLGGVLAVLLR